jgi:hypothetical protein
MKLIVLLLCNSCLIATGCERQKVANTPAKPVDGKDLKEVLAELENVLEKNAPFVHAKLAPPATKDELLELRAGIGNVEMPSLEIWFQWHNGCQDALADLLPLGRMLSISEALQDRKQIRTIPFVDSKRKSALKILDDGTGDGFFVDITSSTPRVFYHMLEDPYPRDYGTLPEFVQFLVNVHSAKLASIDRRGMVDFDLQKYDALEEAHFEQLNDLP